MGLAHIQPCFQIPTTRLLFGHFVEQMVVYLNTRSSMSSLTRGFRIREPKQPSLPYKKKKKKHLSALSCNKTSALFSKCLKPSTKTSLCSSSSQRNPKDDASLKILSPPISHNPLQSQEPPLLSFKALLQPSAEDPTKSKWFGSLFFSSQDPIRYPISGTRHRQIPSGAPDQWRPAIRRPARGKDGFFGHPESTRWIHAAHLRCNADSSGPVSARSVSLQASKIWWEARSDRVGSGVGSGCEWYTHLVCRCGYYGVGWVDRLLQKVSFFGFQFHGYGFPHVTFWGIIDVFFWVFYMGLWIEEYKYDSGLIPSKIAAGFLR